jgi:hypothetical protein
MSNRVRAVSAVVLVAAAAAGGFAVYVAEWLVYSLWEETQPNVYDFSAYAEYRDATGLPIGLSYAAVAALLVGGALMLRRRTEWWGAAAALAVVVALALPVVVPAALPRVTYGEDPVFNIGITFPDPARSRHVACFYYAVEGAEQNRASTLRAPELCIQVPYRGKRPRLLNDRPAELDYDVSMALVNELNESGLRPFLSLEDFRSDRVEVIRAEWVNASGGLANRPEPRPLTPPPTPRGDAGTGSLLLRTAAMLDRCADVPGGYPQCTEIDALRRAGVSIGGDLGQVHISITPRDYRITSTSTTGTAFTIEADGRSRLQVCVPAGQGKCRADGTW